MLSIKLLAYYTPEELYAERHKLFLEMMRDVGSVVENGDEDDPIYDEHIEFSTDEERRQIKLINDELVRRGLPLNRDTEAGR